MIEEAQYVCPSCGEEIVIPVDPSEGLQQEYVEECPICCRPAVVRLELHEDDETVSCQADPE